jgi:hypothetical protein
LVLDLSKCPDPIPLKKIPEISPRIAKAYAGKTVKTLTRDLKALKDMRLIKQESNGYVANKEIIFAFTPLTNEAPPSLEAASTQSLTVSNFLSLCFMQVFKTDHQFSILFKSGE